MSEKMKMLGGVALITLVLLVGTMLVGGNNQQANAENEGSVLSINLSFSQIKDLIGNIGEIFGGDEEFGGDARTRFPHGVNVTEDGCYAVDGTCVIDEDGNFVAAGTLDVTGVTQVGIIQDGNACLATTTSAASETLLEQDLIDNSCFLVSGENDGMTLVFPATNTMTTLLATVGESRTWKFHFATSSTATLTFTEGAGMDFIGPSANDDVIDETETAVIECTRYYSTGALTDITCIIEEHGTVD